MSGTRRTRTRVSLSRFADTFTFQVDLSNPTFTFQADLSNPTFTFVNVCECFKSQERKVTKVVRHPDFDIGTLKYNFAVLFLESSFDAATHIAPVCLPQVPIIDKLTLVVVDTGHYMVYQR